MGNSLFCSLRLAKPATAYLFDAQGHLQRVELHVKAAELMLEAPGCVICPVDELRRTRGIWALRADEELRAGKFYLMFPVKRVYSKVCESELKLIDAACRKKKKGVGVALVDVGVGPKVFPSETEGDKEGVSSKLLLEDQDVMGSPSYRLSNCKQWRPMLEPIHETA